MQRENRAELLDLGAGDLNDVRQNLREIEQINNWLGGTRALLHHLQPLMVGWQSPVRILDVGCGRAGLGRLIQRWAARHRLDVRVLGADWARRSLIVAAENASSSMPAGFFQADVTNLPLFPGAVDLIISQLLMHHLSPGALTHMLRLAFQCARIGVVMCDLVRGWLPYLAYHLVMPLFARHRFTRADGLLSIRRAYTPDEVLSIARQAGLPNPVVHNHWPWRMTLVALK